jgi:type I restriction enzyme S subunit
MSNVPNLRFGEFSGEWEEKLLGKIAIFSKGKGISKADIVENGSTECIRYGELYTQYNELIQNVISKTNINKNDLVLSEYGDIIIPASGETQIDIATASCLLKDNVALGGDLNIIKTNEDGVFLSYYLNNAKKFNIARLSQGISVVHLYSSQLKTLELNLPIKQEQEKIASFLTSVDTKIEQLTKKESLLQEYKKGVMQKIFNQEIRFKDDDGSEFCDWEENFFSEIVIEYRLGGNYSNTENKTEFPLIKMGNINRGKINLSKLEYITTNEDIEEIDKIKYGDLFFNTRNTLDLVGKVAIWRNELPTAYYNSNLMYIKFSNNFFMNYRLNSYEGLKAFRRIATGTTSVAAIYTKDLLKIVLSLPSLKEQIKIANFISSIDNKIEQNKKQLEQTKEFKKALLQQMFV